MMSIKSSEVFNAIKDRVWSRSDCPNAIARPTQVAARPKHRALNGLVLGGLIGVLPVQAIAQAACSVGDMVQFPSVYFEDFGTGAGRSADPNVLNHTFQPSGTIGDDFYAVGRSIDLSSAFMRTLGDIDADGETEGRFLGINMRGRNESNVPPSWLGEFYRQDGISLLPPGLPAGATLGGLRYTTDLVGTCAGCADVPNFTLIIEDNSDGTQLASATSGGIGVANDDIWRTATLDVIPAPSTATAANLVLFNSQPSGANGNDVGVDNIDFAPLICYAPVVDFTKSAEVVANIVGESDAVEAGDIIRYTFTVVNNGSATAYNVSVTETVFNGSGTVPDPGVSSGAADLDGGNGTDTDVAVGATLIFTADYVLTQTDIDNGGVLNNQADVNFQDLLGTTFTDTSDDDDSAVGDQPTVVLVPVAAVDDALGGNVEGATAIIDITANDGVAAVDSTVSLIPPLGATEQVIDGDGDIVGFRVPGQGVWSYVDGTGLLRFVPDSGYNNDPTPIDYTVEAPNGETSNVATVTLDYDIPPIAQNDTLTGLTTGLLPEVNPFADNGSGVDVDPDGSLDPTTVSLTLTGMPADATLVGNVLTVPDEGQWTVNPTNGLVTFAPEAGFTADPTPASYTVDDTDGNTSNEATITLIFIPEPPVAQNDLLTGLTTGLLPEVNPFADNGSGVDADPDGSLDPTTVTLTLTGMPADATLVGNVLTVPDEGQWTVNPTNGLVTFAPEAGFTANPTPASYTVDDNDGNTSNEATITLEFDPRPPVAQNDAVAGLDTGVAAEVDVLADNGSGVDADPDGALDPTTVALTLTGMPGDATLVGNVLTVPGQGVWTVNATTGAVTFAPAMGFTADPTPASYTIDDNDGNTSNEATITLTFVAEPPVAQNDAVAGLDTGVAAEVDVLADNGSGVDADPDGALDPTTVALTLTGMPGDATLVGNVLTVPGQGVWTVNGTTGAVTFAPAMGFTADPTPASYTIDDNDGNTSNEATITLTFVPEPPVAQNDAVADLPTGSPVAVDVLADNGSGVDADPDGAIDPTTVMLTLTGMPGDATLVGNVLTVPGEGVWTVDPVSGVVTFTPEDGFVSDPTPASYTVDDNDGNTSNEGVITLTFTPLEPAIALVKAVSSVADTSGNGVFGDAGDTVNYSFTAENTGDTALAGIVVSDTDLAGLDGTFVLTQPAAGFDGDLAIGEGPVEVATATYILADADIAAGGVTNTADVTSTAVATDAGGDPVPATPLVGIPPVVDGSDAGSDPMLDRATGTVPPIADPAGTGTGDDPTVLTIQSAGDFMLTKTTPAAQVLIGETISYEIVATSMMDAAFGPTQIIDTLPAGLAFVPGSATVDGVAVTPTVSGQSITFSDLTMPANGDLTIALQTRVLTSAPAGTLTNTVDLLDALTGDRLAETASAAVSRTVESTFDCSPVIGKVFDDVNMDGYQNDVPNQSAMISNQDIFVDKLGRGGKLSDAVVDQGEVGLAGVRLVTPSGTIITTDAHGRYAVPCAEIPSGIGSNFMLKLDTRTLPTGYRVTTENPRVMRLTSGLMTEMNFGAALGRVFDVDLSGRAYGGNSLVPSQALATGLEGVLRRIAETPTVIRIAYYRDGEPSDLAHARLNAVEDLIQDQWADIGNYRLLIEKTVKQLQ